MRPLERGGLVPRRMLAAFSGAVQLPQAAAQGFDLLLVGDLLPLSSSRVSSTASISSNEVRSISMIWLTSSIAAWTAIGSAGRGSRYGGGGVSRASRVGGRKVSRGSRIGGREGSCGSRIGGGVVSRNSSAGGWEASCPAGKGSAPG